jgi:mannose-6-phosphate isomerase-like protein (cupin superfamily)
MSTRALRPRRIENPVQGDAVTFLETSAESGGERSLLGLEVRPGGRVTPHFHPSYSEHFFVREGRLTVEVGDSRRELGPGDDAAVSAGARHTWRNEGSEPVLVDVELRPGHSGCEDSLRMLFGLAADGRVMSNGRPRNPCHTALLLDCADARLPRAQPAFGPGLRLLSALARVTGIERRLRRRYLS